MEMENIQLMPIRRINFKLIKTHTVSSSSNQKFQIFSGALALSVL